MVPSSSAEVTRALQGRFTKRPKINKRLIKPLLVVRVGPGTKPKYGSHWTESLIATWKKKKKEKEIEPKRWLVVPRVIMQIIEDIKGCTKIWILFSIMLFITRENKIHIFKPTCNVLFIIWINLKRAKIENRSLILI